MRLYFLKCKFKYRSSISNGNLSSKMGLLLNTHWISKIFIWKKPWNIPLIIVLYQWHVEISYWIKYIMKSYFHFLLLFKNVGLMRGKKNFFVSERYSLLFLITITLFPGQKNVVDEDWKELSSVTDNLPRNSGLNQCAENNSKVWLSPQKEC